MSFVDLCVRNPVKVAVGALLIVLFGSIAVLRMPMQLIPEVQNPVISINTRWPGASPQEVEREIVQEQEEQLKSVEGVREMTSESGDSMAEVELEFVVGTDMSEALLKVNSRLQQVAEYPEDSDEPVISTSSPSDRPIAWLALCERQPGEPELRQAIKNFPECLEAIEHVLRTPSLGKRILRLREAIAKHPQLEFLAPKDVDIPSMLRFVENVVEAQLERVEGVSNANIYGGLTDEVQVILDPAKLAARQLTIDDVRRVLQGQNRDTSGGDYSEGKRRYIVRTVNQFRAPQEIADQLLAVRNSAPVYVRDVAEVNFGYKKPTNLTRRFGDDTISLNIMRESGANVMQVMAGLKDAIADLNENVLAARGLQIIQVYDETEYIDASINLVNENIIVGGALTMIVLMLFLHLGRRTMLFIPVIAATSLAAAFIHPAFFVLTLACVLTAGFWFARGALVVLLAIPISIVGTFLVLWVMGRSLNVISLAGLAFAVGMLVDNAIVVLESIYQHHERGERSLTAAIRGTQEVWGAVVASTATTLAVFLPVLFVREEAGQLFRDIALAISAGVGLSMLVSVTVIPVATAALLRSSDRLSYEPQPDAGWLTGAIESLGDWFTRAILGINAWSQRSLMRRATLVLAAVGGSLIATYAIWPKVEYLPNGNRNLIFASVSLPPGYNFEETQRLGQQVEQYLLPYSSIDPTDPESTELDFPALADYFVSARMGEIFIGSSASDPAEAPNVVKLIEGLDGRLPGARVSGSQASLFGRGSQGRRIDVEISGPEMDRLLTIGRQVLDQAKPTLGGGQAVPEPALELSNPELQIEPRLLQLESLGLNATSLGYTISALVDGAYAGDYIRDGNKIDLTIKATPHSVSRAEDLLNLPISTPSGQLVPLAALADARLTGGPQVITHRERQRAVTIRISPPEEMPLQEAVERIEREIVQPLRDSGELEGGYRIALSGTADKLRSTWEALKWNFILSLLITYLLLAGLFESWLYPLVIITSVPIGMLGGVAALKLLSYYVSAIGARPQNLDVLTMLGFVILIGTVVNNPILIVHQSLNLIRNAGFSARQAILESVASRIRPIFMTTVTTLLGLLPLVLFPGSGSELYRGLGAVVLGGLALSTLVTLIVVPASLSLTLGMQAWFRGHRATADADPEPSDEPLAPLVEV
jgi:HAE1 family hydrophobic/amphiphilic exporter-1